MDISQVILVAIIILGLALAAGAVIFVSGGWIKMARTSGEDVQQDAFDVEDDEDQPPPAGAWKPTTWYSDANEGTLFPNQPSPSFRLSADTSFHRAIALNSQGEPGRQDKQDEQVNGAASEAAGEIGDQLTLPMPRVARVPSAQSPAASDISSDAEPLAAPVYKRSDPVEMAPAHPLPPLSEVSARKPAQPTAAKQTIPIPILAEDPEVADALTNAETVPQLPVILATASPTRDVTNTHESGEPAIEAIEGDDQPTFTALPTVPMAVAPVKDNLPPTVKLRSMRHSVEPRPLPGNAEAVEDSEWLADQETAETVAIPSLPSAPSASDALPAHNPTPASFFSADAPSSVESESPVPLDEPEEQIGEFDTADWPAVILGQLTEAPDESVLEIAEFTATPAQFEPAVMPDYSSAETIGDVDDANDPTEAQEWPSFASTPADDSVSAATNETTASRETIAEEEMPPSLVLPAQSIESNETSENAAEASETDEQRQAYLMVEAYSEVIRLRYDTDLDAVLVNFLGCPVKESIDVAWVFQAIGKQMQEIFPPGTGGRHAMLFDIAGLELAPETEAVWQMVLDAFVTHSCPEVAPNVVLAVQYDSLDRALTEDETSNIEMNTKSHQRSLQITHSFGDAIRLLQELRAFAGN